MSTIQLDVSEIQSLKKRISKMADEIDDCYREVNKLAGQIDMKVRKRKDIDSDLLRIKNDLKKQKEFLSQCERLIGESINEFVEAEKIDRLPDLSFSVGSVGGNSTSKGTSGFLNLLIGSGLLATTGVAGLFIGNKLGVFPTVSLSNYDSLSDYITSKWSELKDTKKLNSFAKDLAAITEEFGGTVPQYITDMLESKDLQGFFKGVGYVADGEKLIKAVSEGDLETLVDLLGKYGIKEPVKALVKLSGESSAGAGLIADFAFERVKSGSEITTETMAEVYAVMANPESDWKDYLKCAYSLSVMEPKISLDTAWNVVGSKADTIANISDFLGISDYATQFEQYTGKEDATIIDFYETVGSDIKNMYGTLGWKDATKILAESTCETIAEQATNAVTTVAGWADSIKGVFSNLV